MHENALLQKYNIAVYSMSYNKLYQIRKNSNNNKNISLAVLMHYDSFMTLINGISLFGKIVEIGNILCVT